MNLSVYDIVGDVCMTREDGEKLHRAFRSALDSGELVTLDFAKTKAFVSAFFNTAIGQLLDHYTREELGQKLKFINVPAAASRPLQKSVDAAEKYYKNPSYRAALDDVLSSMAAQD